MPGNMVDVTLPQLGESVTEGTISKWLVNEGDVVAQGQALLTVSTDKAKVTLDGSVPTALAREIAENDAWYVYGVEEVVNRITVGR